MRSLPEWIGKTDDTPIPPRVRIRIFEKCAGQCVVCGNRIGGALSPAYDHIVSLVNGGENRESNLQLLCVPDHKVKTGQDVAEKSMVYRKKAKHLGIKLKKTRPMLGSKLSGLKKGFDGIVRKR